MCCAGCEGIRADVDRAVLTGLLLTGGVTGGVTGAGVDRIAGIAGDYFQPTKNRVIFFRVP